MTAKQKVAISVAIVIVTIIVLAAATYVIVTGAFNADWKIRLYCVSGIIAVIAVAIIASKQEWFAIHNNTVWDSLNKNLQQHRSAVEEAHNAFSKLDGFSPAIAFDLAVIDLITEKTVDHLSMRSTVYYRSAWFLLLLTVASIVIAIAWFDWHSIPQFIKGLAPDKGAKDFGGFSPAEVMTMFLVRSVTMGALFGAAPVILGGLSLSYFHEATAAYHQRHTIRLGRLWVELQLSGEDPRKPPLKEFMQAFGLESQPATSFRRLRMPKSVTGETAEMVKAILSFLKTTSKKTSSANDE